MNTLNLRQQLNDDLLNLLKKAEQACKEPNLCIGIFENSSNVQYSLEEFFNQYNPEEIGKGQCNLLFRIDFCGSTIATFQLKDMYNCCGIIVGSDLFVHKIYRNIGIGTILTKFMMDFSFHYGYGVLQGADRKDNEYQTLIFKKLGWTKVSEFNNPKTKNVLNMWLFNLSENKNAVKNENQ